jgi:hypothetical protein
VRANSNPGEVIIGFAPVSDRSSSPEETTLSRSQEKSLSLSRARSSSSEPVSVSVAPVVDDKSKTTNNNDNFKNNSQTAPKAKTASSGDAKNAKVDPRGPKLDKKTLSKVERREQSQREQELAKSRKPQQTGKSEKKGGAAAQSGGIKGQSGTVKKQEAVESSNAIGSNNNNNNNVSNNSNPPKSSLGTSLSKHGSSNVPKVSALFFFFNSHFLKKNKKDFSVFRKFRKSRKRGSCRFECEIESGSVFLGNSQSFFFFFKLQK